MESFLVRDIAPDVETIVTYVLPKLKRWAVSMSNISPKGVRPS